VPDIPLPLFLDRVSRAPRTPLSVSRAKRYRGDVTLRSAKLAAGPGLSSPNCNHARLYLSVSIPNAHSLFYFSFGEDRTSIP